MCPQAGQTYDICLSSYIIVHYLALAMHYVTKFISCSKTMQVTTRRVQCIHDFVYLYANLAFVKFAHSECLTYGQSYNSYIVIQSVIQLYIIIYIIQYIKYIYIHIYIYIYIYIEIHNIYNLEIYIHIYIYIYIYIYIL